MPKKTQAPTSAVVPQAPATSDTPATSDMPAVSDTPDPVLPDLLVEAIQSLQELRKSVDRAEAALFLRAHFIEMTMRDLWKPYFPTFDRLLERFFICDAVRYRDFIEGQRQPDVALHADVIGVPSVIQAAKIPDPVRRQKFIEAAETRVKETGAAWSDQQARLERLKIGGSAPRDSKWNGVAGESKRLREELIALKRANHALSVENANLKAEVNKLRSKVIKLGGKA